MLALGMVERVIPETLRRPPIGPNHLPTSLPTYPVPCTKYYQPYVSGGDLLVERRSTRAPQHPADQHVQISLIPHATASMSGSMKLLFLVGKRGEAPPESH